LDNDICVTNLTALVDGKPLLNGIDFRFLAGKVTLIVGRSGSGKTMLLETLSGLREINSGQIQIGKAPLWKGESSRKKLQRETMLLLGTGFQHPEQQLFAQTIEEEFRYNLRPYRLSPEQQKERIVLATRHYAGESEDWLKQDPFKLSGGQKRRLTLAILEASGPDWLLLDEPTSGVDVTGVSSLCQQLQQRKASGKGTIVVTHDLDGLIEAADQLLIMKDGQVFWHGTPAEIYEQPHTFEAAGLALPIRMETQRMLQRAGFQLPSGWPNAFTTATAIVLQIAEQKDKVEGQSEVDTDDLKPQLRLELHPKSSLVQFQLTKQDHPIQDSFKKSKARLKIMDPRSIWLTYILISSGILLQSHWLGWILSCFVTMGVIIFAGVSHREWSKPALGLLLFACIAALLSGLSFGARNIGFAVDPALATFFHFSRLVMIMLTGFVLLSGINHLHLKRVLEQSLHGLRYLRVPVEQFALTAALMIRFLPLLINEWDRFARIAAARGKFAVRPGSIPLRGLRMTVIPYLMALLRLGELLSLILIIRGIGLAGRKETRAYKLSFQKVDYILVIIAIVVLVILILVDKIA
jgi:energy-coupling factor transport system permease/ATP-binding protein